MIAFGLTPDDVGVTPIWVWHGMCDEGFRVPDATDPFAVTPGQTFPQIPFVWMDGDEPL